MNLQVLYNQLLRKKHKGIYLLSAGKMIHNSNGLYAAVFISTDYKNIAIVKSWFGSFAVQEV